MGCIQADRIYLKLLLLMLSESLVWEKASREVSEVDASCV